MCGIFAIRGPVGSSALSEVVSQLSLRGPDSFAELRLTNFTPAIQLISTRLAFVGSTGFPLNLPTGEVLVASGEIYNHEEIHFETTGRKPDEKDNDFLSLLIMYRKLKITGLSPTEAFKRLLQTLRADFAIVLVDEAEKVVLVARDVFGVRPLWYVFESESFWGFCSEERPLTKFDPGFANSLQVSPGHFACFSLGGSVDNIEWVTYTEFQTKSLPVRGIPSQLESFSAIVQRLTTLLKRSVEYHTQNLGHGQDRRIGVFFSGGIDSGVIYSLCKQLNVNAVPITLNAGVSSDVAVVREVFGPEEARIWRTVSLTDSEIEANLRSIVGRLSVFNPLDISIAIPLFFLAREAKKLTLKACLTGQGADELFFGYQRYEKRWKEDQNSLRLVQESWSDLIDIAKRNLERDDLIASYHGIELRLPYLDLELVRYVSRFPVQFFFKNLDSSETDVKVQRKFILREVGRMLGVDSAIVERRKQAIQYGSGVAKALERLAHKERLKVVDYLKAFV